LIHKKKLLISALIFLILFSNLILCFSFNANFENNQSRLSDNFNLNLLENVSYLNIRSYEYRDVPEELFYIYLGADEQIVLFDFRNYTHREDWNKISEAYYSFSVDSMYLILNNSGVYHDFNHLGIAGFYTQNLTLIFKIKVLSGSQLIIILDYLNYKADYPLNISNFNYTYEIHIPFYLFQKYNSFDGLFSSIAFYSVGYFEGYLAEIKVANWHNSYYLIKNETELKLNSSTIHLKNSSDYLTKKEKNLTIQAEAQAYNDSNNILINSTSDFNNYSYSNNCTINDSLSLTIDGNYLGTWTWEEGENDTKLQGWSYYNEGNDRKIVYQDSVDIHKKVVLAYNSDPSSNIYIERGISLENGTTIEILTKTTSYLTKVNILRLRNSATTYHVYFGLYFQSGEIKYDYKKNGIWYHNYIQDYDSDSWYHFKIKVDTINYKVKISVNSTSYGWKSVGAYQPNMIRIIVDPQSKLYLDSYDFSNEPGYYEDRVLDSKYYNKCIYNTKAIVVNNSIQTQINFSKQVNENTSCLVSYAISEDNETFTEFSNYFSDNFTINTNHSYLKLRILLNTSNNLQTPALDFINITYTFINYTYIINYTGYFETNYTSYDIITKFTVNSSLRNSLEKWSNGLNDFEPPEEVKTNNDEYWHGSTPNYWIFDINGGNNIYIDLRLNYTGYAYDGQLIIQKQDGSDEILTTFEINKSYDMCICLNNSDNRYIYNNKVYLIFQAYSGADYYIFYLNVQNISIKLYNFSNNNYDLLLTTNESSIYNTSFIYENYFNHTHLFFNIFDERDYEFNITLSLELIIYHAYENYINLTYNVSLCEFEEITFNYKNNESLTNLLIILKNSTDEYILANLSKTNLKISYYNQIDTRYNIYYYNITSLQQHNFTQLILHFKADNSLTQIQNYSCFIRFFVVNDLLTYRLESEQNRQRYDVLVFNNNVETLLIKDVFGRDVFRQKVQYQKFIDVYISIAELVLVNEANFTTYFEFYISLGVSVYYSVPAHSSRIITILVGDYWVSIKNETQILEIREIRLTNANRTTISYKQTYEIRPPDVSTSEPWYHTGVELLDMMLDVIFYIFSEGFVPYGLVIVLFFTVVITYDITKYYMKKRQKKMLKELKRRQKLEKEIKSLRGY